MNISTQISRKFRFVSTCSMVMVVFIHAKFIMSRWDVCMKTDCMVGRISDIVQFSISEMLCRLAVPLFFLTSGFFMANRNDGSIQTYIYKIKGRARSILVPYLIFSIAWLAISMFANRIENVGIKDFLLYSFVSPIPFQFWFLQHLMALTLLSILLYQLLKHFRISVRLLLGFIYFLLDNDIRTGFGGSLFYYAMGMSLYMNPLTNKALRYKNLFIYTFILLFIVCFWIRFLGIEIGHAIYGIANKIMIFCGVCWCVWWILLDKQLFNVPKGLTMGAGTSFLIFCLHEPLLSFLKNTYLHIFSTQHGILVGYFILPLVTIFLCLLVDYLIKKTNTTLYKVLTGNR